MNNKPSFKDCSVVSCGTMRPELNHLRDQGFLDADKVLFTGPGLHDKPGDLEDQMNERKFERVEKSIGSSRLAAVLEEHFQGSGRRSCQ